MDYLNQSLKISQASPSELKRLVQIATSTDDSISKTTLQSRETARALLSDLLLLMYQGSLSTTEAQSKITSLLIDLLQEGPTQQFLCFRLLLSMALRNHQTLIQHDDDDESSNVISNSLYAITKLCTTLLLNVRPVANDKTWTSATSCIIYYMSLAGRESGSWIETKVLIEIVQRSQRTDAKEETLTFCDLLSERILSETINERNNALIEIGGLDRLVSLFAASTEPEMCEMLMEMILLRCTDIPVNESDTKNTSNTSSNTSTTNPHQLLLSPHIITPLLHQALNIYPTSWSTYLFQTFGIQDIHFENCTKHHLTQTIFTYVSRISISDAENTANVLIHLHQTMFLRENTKNIMETCRTKKIKNTTTTNKNSNRNARKAWDMINVLFQRCQDTIRVDDKRTYMNSIVYVLKRDVLNMQHDTKENMMLQGWKRILSKWCGHDSTSDSIMECCLLGRCISAALNMSNGAVSFSNVICEAMDRLLSCISRMIHTTSTTTTTRTAGKHTWMKEHLLESMERIIYSMSTFAAPLIAVNDALVPLIEHLLVSTSISIRSMDFKNDVVHQPTQERRAILSQWRCSSELKRHAFNPESLEYKERVAEDGLFFQKLALDLEKNVAGPPATIALKTMKEQNAAMYYERLKRVVVLARDTDDETMITDTLKLYTELNKIDQADRKSA